MPGGGGGVRMCGVDVVRQLGCVVGPPGSSGVHCASMDVSGNEVRLTLGAFTPTPKSQG